MSICFNQYVTQYCGKLEQHEEHITGLRRVCLGGNACPIAYDHNAYEFDTNGQENCAVCGWSGEGDEYWHG